MSVIVSSYDNIIEQQLLLVLLIDSTGSMVEDGLLDAINTGLRSFKNTLLEDESGLSQEKIQLSVISYSDVTRIDLMPTSIWDVEIPTLIALGKSSLFNAVRLSQEVIEEFKRKNKEKGLAYYKPIISCISDYMFDEDAEATRDIIAQGCRDKKYAFYPIAVGNDYDLKIITSLSNFFPGVSLSKDRINGFFVNLASNIVNRFRKNIDTHHPYSIWEFGENPGIKLIY